jgi:hypothetical protein
MNRQDRAEVKVLLLCTQPARNAVDTARLKSLLNTGLNWDFLFKLARRHSLLPLLSQRLNQTAGESVPLDELQRLQLAYEQNVARNLIFVAELSQLVKALHDAGIEAITYKGPVLAVVAYGNPALRRFIDLDLMVRRRDVLAATDVLVRHGYVAAKDLSVDQQALLLRTQHNVQFTRDRRRFIVELHWQVSSHLFASSVTAEELWNNSETVTLNGVDFKTFSTANLLFSLCVHGSRHLWERLAWIADVAHLLNTHPAIEWPVLLERAKNAQAERMFLLGLHLANALLQAPLSAMVKRRVESDKRIAALAERIIARLFDGTEHHPATAGEIFKYNLQVRSNWGARARYFLFMFEPTDSDLEQHRLPNPLRFAYYLLRPFRLVSGQRSGARAKPTQAK